MLEREKDRFRRLMDKTREGSHEAAWELFEDYGSHIQRAVRHSMGKQLRRVYDSDDFIQSVWAAFWGQPSIVRANTPEQFIALLSRMAKNKVIDKVRMSQALKNNDEGQQSLDTMSDEQLGKAGGPSPSQYAIARERWNEIMESLPSSKQILNLRMGGATFQEISDILKISERTARRAVKRALDRFSDSEGSDSTQYRRLDGEHNAPPAPHEKPPTVSENDRDENQQDENQQGPDIL